MSRKRTTTIDVHTAKNEGDYLVLEEEREGVSEKTLSDGLFVGAIWIEERYRYKVVRVAAKSVIMESVTGHQWRWTREQLRRRARWERERLKETPK